MKRPTESIKSEAFSIMLVVTSFLFGLYCYGRFPQQVASHWNIYGVVDGYTGKAFGAFMPPVVLLLLSIMFAVLPSVDPKKDRYPEFIRVYRLVKHLILGLLFVIFVATGLYNLGYPVQIGTLTPILIGLLMIVLGNFMGKIKPNYFMGIRTPWTLASDSVWNKTHRVGGYSFVFFGICLLLTPFVPTSLTSILFALGVGATTVGTILYSYIAFKQEQNK